MNRKQGLSEQDREDYLKLNKISHERFKEAIDRGFDILTNDPLKGPEATRPLYEASVGKPRGVWTKALQTVNRGNIIEVNNLQTL